MSMTWGVTSNRLPAAHPWHVRCPQFKAVSRFDTRHTAHAAAEQGLVSATRHIVPCGLDHQSKFDPPYIAPRCKYKDEGKRAQPSPPHNILTYPLVVFGEMYGDLRPHSSQKESSEIQLEDCWCREFA